MDNEKQFEDGDVEDLERKLREGLRHVPAPLGFEARVMVAARNLSRQRHWMRLRWSWGFAMVLLCAGGVAEYEHVEYMRKAAEAHEQAGLALHIVAVKLELVRHELNDKGEER